MKITDKETIEKRLQAMKNIYLKVGDILDGIPDVIPGSVRNLIRDKILGDPKLKDLMDGIDHRRLPRFLLVGRTGVGKSSLINAMAECYVAQVSDVTSCTTDCKHYTCKRRGEVLWDIFDTRGIAESTDLNSKISAEDQLVKNVVDFSPDVAILMLNCAHRDSVDDDAQFLKKVLKKYKELNQSSLPVVVVCTRADEVAPSRYKDPDQYPQRKIDSINEIVANYKKVLIDHGLKITDIVAVSSYIDWMTADGEEVSSDSINSMTEEEIGQLQISYDARYNIDKLIDILGEAIEDFQARMWLKMTLRLDRFIKNMANTVTDIFAGIAGGVAVTPIPLSDIYILLILQAVLVMIIASLSGRDVSLDTAKEFVFSLLGVGGIGLGFRLAAQQASKAINVAVPAAGSAISAALAAGGTKLIGKAAIAYYIDQKSTEEAKKQFNLKNILGFLHPEKKPDTPSA